MSASYKPPGLTGSGSMVAQRKIGVFRALQLGDLLCVVPALRALRVAAPTAHITLIGLPWSASFARRFSKYIDAHIRFPGFPGLHEQPVDLVRVPEFIGTMQQQRFDCMLQMHGSGVLTNPLAMTFGAGRNAGFFREGDYCPDPRHFMCWDEQQHEILRNVQLMEFLGVPAQGEDLEFPLVDADYRALFHGVDALPAPGSYVCIHAGARMLSRRWPAACFAEVADRMHAAGLRVVLTGAAQESGVVQSVQRNMRSPALNLAGKTELGPFAALVKQARLVVCNDTGISHIAAAVKTPSVVVCCGADPKRWAPLNWRRHRTVHAEVVGRPCSGQVMTVIRQVLVDNPLIRAPSGRQEIPLRMLP